MEYKQLHFLKIASLTTGQRVLNVTGIEQPKFITPELPKAPELPKTPKSNPLKLTTGKGKKKPLYTHKKPTSSPYNPN